MITLIPSLEVMKAVVDVNIDSEPSKVRIEAFNKLNELLGFNNLFEIVIEGHLYERISHCLKEDHKKVFEELYDIDYSAIKVNDYDIEKLINTIISI